MDLFTLDGGSLLSKVSRVTDLIVQPPRTTYDIAHVCPIRVDYLPSQIDPAPISFQNARGQWIIGSFYPSVSYHQEAVHRAVVYLHGNAGTQLEGRAIVPHLVPRRVSVFLFDFTGRGLSDGEFVSLGLTESEDVIACLDFLAGQFDCTDFVLWGRSMGAAAAVIAAPSHPLVRGIIVDSTFSSLDDMFTSLSARVGIPAVLRSVAKWWIKRKVQERSGLDVDSVSPIDAARLATVPMIMGHSCEDDFIPIEQARKLYRAYGCPRKEFVPLFGVHEANRPVEWVRECLVFVAEAFGIALDDFDYEALVETGGAEEEEV
jgi:pimeloyl-ACP methyl ester carboxylesterase